MDLSFTTGTAIGLTATASQTVSSTGYAINIIDQTAGTTIATCTTGTTCSASTVPTTAQDTYIAQVGSSSTIAATSSPVTPPAWSATLSGTYASSQFTLTATTNYSIHNGVYIDLWDETSTSRLTDCTSNTVTTSCSVSTVPTHTSDTYLATVSPSSVSSYPPATVLASSGTVDSPAWQVTLTADVTTSFTFNLTSNYKLSTGQYLVVYDTTTDHWADYCGAYFSGATSCTIANQVPKTHQDSYVAAIMSTIVSSWSGAQTSGDLLAQSTNTLTPPPWSMALTITTGDLVAQTNYDLTDSGQVAMLYDESGTGTFANYEYECAGSASVYNGPGTLVRTPTSCTIPVPSDGGPWMGTLGGEVPKFPPYPSPLLAVSNQLVGPASFAGERSGGSNPSASNDCRACAGEPIDTESGNFFESAADITVPGDGPALNLARTYSADLATADGPFGLGWSFSYGPYLGTDPADTTSMVVHQETGATVAFSPDGNGGYVAPDQDFATLTHNGDGTWTFVRKEQQTFTFNSAGALTAITDRNNQSTTLSYDGQGRLASVTDPSGRAITFGYNPAGRIASATDPAGNAVQYGYNAAGDLTSVRDRDGNVTSYGYDDWNRLTTITRPNGGATTNSYDAGGRVTAQTGPDNKTTTYAYAVGLTSGTMNTTITSAEGRVTVDEFTDGELTGKTVASGTPDAGTWTYTYDPATQCRTSTIDPAGHTWSATYDAQGHVLTATDPSNSETHWTYNRYGEVLTMTDPDNDTTTNTYDGNGNLLSTATPLTSTGQPRTTSYAYTDATHPGLPTSTTDPDGNTTRFGYDRHGDLTTTTTPANDTATATFDVLGRMTSAEDARQHTTTYDYDPDGNLTTTTLPTAESPTIKRSYDGDGNLASVTDQENNTTSYSYDLADQLITTTRPDNSTTQTSYDGDGNVLSTTNGMNKTTSYTYNAREALISSTDPDNRTTSYAYGSAGRLTTVTEPNAATVSYGYDPTGHRTSISYSDGTPSVSYGYDPDGLRTSMSDGTGQTSYTYDSLHRLTQIVTGSGNTIKYGYDLAGRTTSITYPDGHKVARGYDTDGRLHTVTDWNGHTTTYNYDPNSNPQTEAYPNGVTASYGYDPANQLTDITDTTTGGTTLASFTYTRGGDGELSTASSTGFSDPEHSYGYNARQQLTSDVTSGNTTAFGYDAADQITTLAGNTLGYDAAGQLTSNTTADGKTTSYTYDGNGNRTGSTTPTAPQTIFAGNAAGQLTSATTPGTSDGPAPGGYYLYTAGGMVYQSHNATWRGNNSQQTNIVGMAATPDGGGYWLAGSDGVVYPHGDAETIATNSTTYANPIIGITASPTGGYYLYTAHGNVYNTTDATFYGSNKTITNIVGMALTPDGKGYWLVGSDGVVYPHGDAETVATNVTSYAHPIIGIAANPTGGYYLYTAHGNVYNTTDATFYGSNNTVTNIAGMALTPDGEGYWLVGSDGTLYPHGDAADVGTAATSYVNPIIGITAAPNTTTFTYNGDGLRATEINQKNTTTFTYDTTTAVPQLLTDGTTDYIYGLSDEPIEQVDAAGTTSYLQHDQLGSTRVITDSTGGTTATYTYDPYGNTTSHTGTATTPLQFAAGYRDPATGLYYLTHRYYDPATAQFLTIDPAVAQTQQAYAYAQNSPTSFTDPSGLCSSEESSSECAWGGFISLVAREVAAAAVGVGLPYEWIVNLIERDPLAAAGIALAIAAAIAGGGALAESEVFGIYFETLGNIANGAAFVSGALDVPKCVSGVMASCAGAAVNFLAGGLGTVAKGLDDGIAKGLLNAKGFAIGIGASLWDTGGILDEACSRH